MNVTARALSLALVLAATASGEPPAVLSLAEAEGTVLKAWDEQDGQGSLPRPSVDPRDKAGLRWLLAAAGPGVPANPFPKRTTAWKEAESVRSLLQGKASAAALRNLPLNFAGSALALWNWARPQDLPSTLRKAWEDRLLEPTIPSVLRTSALRHALCFALAEGDTERFGHLRREIGDEDPDLFMTFQRTFALLGGASPRFRLWRLPDLQRLECGLQDLGPRRILIHPWLKGERPFRPEGAAWIIPLLEDRLPGLADGLDTPRQKLGETLGRDLGADARDAWYAPGEEPFSGYGLIFFPVDIELDPEGRIQRIAMGDASTSRAEGLRRSPRPAAGR